MRPSDPLTDHLLVQWLLESVRFWISASILLMGLVISKTQSSPVGLWHLRPLLLSTLQTLQHTHSHCYLSVWRKDPGGAFAWSLFSSLLSGLHWVLGCMMLFSSFLYIFFSIFQLCFRIQTNVLVHPLHFKNLSVAGGCFMISPR